MLRLRRPRLLRSVRLCGVILSQLSSTRAVLIGAGTITSTSTGTVEEAVPGLFEYIRRQPDALEAISAAQQNAPTSRRATTVVDRKSSKRHER